MKKFNSILMKEVKYGSVNESHKRNYGHQRA